MMMHSPPRTTARRRFLSILGGIAGAALFPSLSRATAASAPAIPRWRWRGVALGARAEITLCHPNRVIAGRAVNAAVAEIERLEGIFSLYRPNSDISRLNRDGQLNFPSGAFVDLMAASVDWSRWTGGAFDPTVQPLWQLYAKHFASPHANRTGPPAAAMAAAQALVDWQALDIAPDRIAFRRPGMSVTLNGIAQGFITDQVAQVLRRHGIDNVLCDIGEAVAIGRPSSDRAWRLAIETASVNGEIAGTIEFGDGAVASSAGWATRFDTEGRHHHLFDPRTGGSAAFRPAVTVVAPDGTTADALSTAFFVMPEDQFAMAVESIPNISIYVQHEDGKLRRVRGKDG